MQDQDDSDVVVGLGRGGLVLPIRQVVAQSPSSARSQLLKRLATKIVDQPTPAPFPPFPPFPRPKAPRRPLFSSPLPSLL